MSGGTISLQNCTFKLNGKENDTSGLYIEVSNSGIEMCNDEVDMVEPWSDYSLNNCTFTGNGHHDAESVVHKKGGGLCVVFGGCLSNNVLFTIA